MSSSFLDNLLKSVLKRQMPYLIGGTITGTIMAYYYGFLFTIIVNSIAWFVISTLVNKYYWKYTGFKEEFQLISKYIGRIKKRKSKNNLAIKLDDHKEEDNTDRWYFSIDKRNNKTDNLGRSSKIKNLGK
jgi:p-aminobenzoyl-glutamate transporter AbgT